MVERTPRWRILSHRGKFRLRLALGVFALSISACLAPTLPVPPPVDPQVSAPDSSGFVTVKGGPGSADSEATVTIINYTLRLRCEGSAPPAPPGCSSYGALTYAGKDGSWQVGIRGQSKDDLYVSQTADGRESSQLTLKVP